MKLVNYTLSSQREVCDAWFMTRACVIQRTNPIRAKLHPDFQGKAQFIRNELNQDNNQQVDGLSGF